MREIRLDGRKMTTKTDAHRYLKETLRLPEYYGCNFDALNDCLQDLRDVRIRLHHVGAMLNAPGSIGQTFIEVFEAAAKENPELEFIKDVKPF